MTIRIILGVLLFVCSALLAEQRGVYVGIDVLEINDFTTLSGARVGLITNHTGMTRDGRSTITLLHEAANVDLVRIFSPEHGIEGKLDIATISNGTESMTGIPIVSLYGETRRPGAANLVDIDALVFDIQDIGTRFYTYISTMGNAMAAAAEYDIRFVVLDRPNPINGIDVSGPVLDDGRQSFVAFHTLPIRHGMTVGEIALMLKSELGLDLELDIVRLDGWHRSDFFDDTGLTWINPSPNMRSLRAAILYPGIGLLETTNISVGRGTDTPFEIFGAPWLDGASMAQQLNALRLPGMAFDAVEFTPDASTFSGEACSGVRITITDRDLVKPVHTGLEIARRLVLDYPETWNTDRYIRLLGNGDTLASVLGGSDINEIRSAYADGLDRFIERRKAFLLYD